MKPRRIFAPSKGVVETEEYDMPDIEPGKVMVESLYTSISPGTELAWLNHMANTPGNYPYYPGYSGCCKIIGKADDVEELEVGQVVACYAKHASHQIMDADKCLVLPESVSKLEASAYQLASIAIQGVRKAQIQLGNSVCVLGLGPIGNLAAQISKVAGASYVEGIDLVDWRRDIALQCGLDAVSSCAEESRLKSDFDVVIEATGVPNAISTAFKIANKYGRVILLGSTRGNVDNVDFYSDVHKKGLTIIGAHTLCRAKADIFGPLSTHRNDEETVINLMSQGRISTAKLISEISTVENAAIAYEKLMKKDEKLMLIAFKWK